MDNLTFMIAQGSTPRIELYLPFEADEDDVIYVTLTQTDRIRLEYTMNGSVQLATAGSGTLELDDEDSSVVVLSMTQADTLALKPGDVELQLRIVTAVGCDTFMPIPGAVIRSMKTGVISR